MLVLLFLQGLASNQSGQHGVIKQARDMHSHTVKSEEVQTPWMPQFHNKIFLV